MNKLKENEMNKLLKCALVMIGITLTGCAQLNSNFDCPMKPGVTCKSLDQVNAHVDSGEIGAQGIDIKHQQVALNRSYSRAQLTQTVTNDHFLQRRPIRYAESVMHIWFAPFEDHSGNYHLESEVYTVVSPGHWAEDPRRDIEIYEE